LLDPGRLRAWNRRLNDHRRPLLEVDADLQAQRRVEAVEQAAVQAPRVIFGWIVAALRTGGTA